MQYQYYPPVGSYQNAPQPTHAQQYPNACMWSPKIHYQAQEMQMYAYQPQQMQMHAYQQNNPQRTSTVQTVVTPPSLVAHKNQDKKKSKNGTQHHVHSVQSSPHHVHLVQTPPHHMHSVQTSTQKKTNGKNHLTTASHTNAHSTPSVAASATPHPSAKSTTSGGNSTGSVGSTKSGPKVRNQNYATKMLLDSRTLHDLNREVIIDTYTDSNEDVREARDLYKHELEAAMKSSSKGMKQTKFLPSDKDNFDNSPNMIKHLAAITEDLKQASEKSHKSLETTVNCNYTDDSILHEHNKIFLEQKIAEKNEHANNENVELEKLENQVRGITNLDENSKKI